jgi:hypothetical protein
MKTPLITQLCMYSCVPDCWAHFMRERGVQITSEDILKNHRDLCWWNPPDAHQYGTISDQYFPTLASRYLLTAVMFAPTTIVHVTTELDAGNGVFGLAASFKAPGTIKGHAFRITGATANDLEIIIPGLPHGTRENATLPILQSWATQFYRVS